MAAGGIRMRLETLIEPLVRSSGAFLVDLVFRGEQGSRVLEVFVDTDEGVSTDLCAAISRTISSVLDRENIIAGRYYLVVSSPGVDRPLKSQRQYRRHIGHVLSVRYTDESETRSVEGELQAVSDEWIVLKKSVGDSSATGRAEEALRIPFGSISEARLKLSW